MNQPSNHRSAFTTRAQADFRSGGRKRMIGAGAPEDVLVPDVLEQTYGSPMQILEHGGMRVVVDGGPNSSVLPFRRASGDGINS